MIIASEARERANNVEHSAIVRLSSDNEEENTKIIFAVAEEAIASTSSDGYVDVNIIIVWNSSEVNLNLEDFTSGLEKLGYSVVFNEYKYGSQTNESMLTLCISW